MAGENGAIAAIEAGRAAGAAAINVLASPMLYSMRKAIFEHSLRAQLPAIYQWPEAAAEGGLIAYGPRFAEVYRRFARQAAKLLRGAKPATLPIEQPTKFALAINTATAKTLGLAIPPALLARADEIVE